MKWMFVAAGAVLFIAVAASLTMQSIALDRSPSMNMLTDQRIPFDEVLKAEGYREIVITGPTNHGQGPANGKAGFTAINRSGDAVVGYVTSNGQQEPKVHVLQRKPK